MTCNSEGTGSRCPVLGLAYLILKESMVLGKDLNGHAVAFHMRHCPNNFSPVVHACLA